MGEKKQRRKGQIPKRQKEREREKLKKQNA